jgi:hypothetical protein
VKGNGHGPSRRLSGVTEQNKGKPQVSLSLDRDLNSGPHNTFGMSLCIIR